MIWKLKQDLSYWRKAVWQLFSRPPQVLYLNLDEKEGDPQILNKLKDKVSRIKSTMVVTWYLNLGLSSACCCRLRNLILGSCLWMIWHNTLIVNFQSWICLGIVPEFTIACSSEKSRLFCANERSFRDS